MRAFVEKPIQNGCQMPRPPRSLRWNYTAAELWADGVVHVAGTALAISASVVFLVWAVDRISPGEFAAVAIYLVTLLLSLGLSAVYNIWPVSPTKWLLRRFDHSAIYLLIAGTYTPFLVKSETWWLLATVWSIAVLGVLLKLLKPHRFDRLSILLYLGLGWSGVIVYDELTGAVPPAVPLLIVAGGLVYSLGVIFHVWERLKFQNAIWHSFVLSGACTHFIAVWIAVAP